MKRKQQAASAREKHVSEKTRVEVLADIRQLEQAGDLNKLGGYFIQLAKWGEQPQQYENLFSSYLNSPTARLREAAIFCLLFALQSRKSEYRAAGMAMVADDTEDFDIRNWAGAGLGVAYRATKDPELLRLFFARLDDEAENKLLKSTFVNGLLKVWGLSSWEQDFRLGSRSSLKAVLQEFQQELVEARLSLMA